MFPPYVIGCTTCDGHVTEGLNRFCRNLVQSKCCERAANFAVLCIVELFFIQQMVHCWILDKLYSGRP